jgi:hypothetical protein
MFNGIQTITERKDIRFDDIFSFPSFPHTSKNQHEDGLRNIKRVEKNSALISMEMKK